MKDLQNVCKIKDSGAVIAIVTCAVFFCLLLGCMMGYISDALGLKDHTIRNLTKYLTDDPIPHTWMPFIFGIVCLAASTTGSVFVIQDAKSKRTDPQTCTLLKMSLQEQELNRYKPSLEEAQMHQLNLERTFAASCNDDALTAIAITVGILAILFFVLPMIRSTPSMKMLKVTPVGYAFAFFAMIITLYAGGVAYDNSAFTQGMACRI